MQEKEKNLDDVYIFWLERVMKALKKHKKDVFKSIGIELTSDQWVVLKRCDEQPGITQKEIAESTFKDPASITRIIDILEKKKLLKREQGKDRRNYTITLTANGENIIKKVIPIAIEKRNQGLEGVTEDETKMLIATLEKIWNNLM